VLISLLATAALLAAAPAPPPVDAQVDYQLGGAYQPEPGIEVVARDRTERVAPGRYNICYVNAYQTQPGELGWWRDHRPQLLLRRHGASGRRRRFARPSTRSTPASPQR